jgi:hemolysin D
MAEQKAAGLAQDIITAEKRSRLQMLTAPVDGILQQLAVHTVGGVVTPAQPLLALAPADSHLEIEAIVSNRDIGFVHAGQQAEIKVETFNFTRYGLLHGQVLSVSSDVITRDNSQNQSNGGVRTVDDAGSTPSPKSTYGRCLARSHANVGGREAGESLAGMAVTAEIRTGSRRVISYLLSPLARYRQESLRER